ncbi:hypothetical protein C8R45DRAFT_766101, partial [Mycena sanguinolenta]
RCRQCFGDELLCASCCVERHVDNPFHCIEKWTGMFFQSSSLKELGLRIQLGHLPRDPCSTPRELHSKFVILHTNGIFEVAMDACDCEHALSAGSDEIQLLRAGLFPAT